MPLPNAPDFAKEMKLGIDTAHTVFFHPQHSTRFTIIFILLLTKTAKKNHGQLGAMLFC